MIEQIYEDYTSEDLKVWSILFERQIENLPDNPNFFKTYEGNIETVIKNKEFYA